MSAPTATRQDEAQVARLAAELLEVTSEEELEDFLGSLASSVIKGAKSFMKSGVGKAVGGALRSIAKTALPAVGGALGSFLLPGVGTAIGARLGSVAGGLLEVGEAEALGEAEAEYEAAFADAVSRVASFPYEEIAQVRPSLDSRAADAFGARPGRHGASLKVIKPTGRVCGPAMSALGGRSGYCLNDWPSMQGR